MVTAVAPLTRFEDWEVRLHAAVNLARARPFAWGGHDCALFAAGVVQEITGVDVAQSWRGYGSERQALRIVRDAGGLAKLVTSALGEQPIRPAFARRGDVVLIEQDGAFEAALGICAGPHAVFARAPLGLSFVPLRAWRVAWRVGWCPR